MDDMKLKFLICVNYKSGIQMKFWCSKFEYTPKPSGGSYKWTLADNKVAPVDLNANEIESVWQIDQTH